MNDSITKKQEIIWINALKAICIIFIYVHHCEFYCDYQLSTIRPLYMPFFTNAFFFVSGYLLFRKQLAPNVISQNISNWMSSWGGHFLKNVLFKLVIPTMLFTAITFLPKMVLRGGDSSWVDCVEATILGKSYWFTCALVVSELLIFILLLSRAKSILIYLGAGVVAVVISLLLNYKDVMFFGNASTPWYYKSGFVATLFLSLGGLYWKYEDNVDSIFKGWRKVMLIILLSIFIIVALFFNKHVDCIVTNGTINLLGLLLMMISTYLLIYLCKLIPENRFVWYVGRHSIGFYFFCGAIPNILALMLFRLGLVPAPTTTLICTLASIIIACPVVYLINRFLPFLFDLRIICKKNI